MRKSYVSRIFEAAQCLGKQGFDSYQQAAKLARAQSRRKTKTINVYRCGFCHKWHTGGTHHNNLKQK